MDACLRKSMISDSILGPGGFRRGSKNHVVGDNVGKNAKLTNPETAPEKYESLIELSSKNELLWDVKLELASHACFEIGGLGVS